MCDQCDEQCPTGDEVMRRVRGQLAEQRFCVVSVRGCRQTPELSYTVGLTCHGLPELIVVAVRHDEATRLLDVWGSYLLDDSVVLPGETLDCGPWLMEAVEVARPHEHLLVARRLFGDHVRALQLVWADSAGRWPWDAGHQARRAGQPVLGRRAPRYCSEHALSRLDPPDP